VIKATLESSFALKDKDTNIHTAVGHVIGTLWKDTLTVDSFVSINRDVEVIVNATKPDQPNTFKNLVAIIKKLQSLIEGRVLSMVETTHRFSSQACSSIPKGTKGCSDPDVLKNMIALCNRYGEDMDTTLAAFAKLDIFRKISDNELRYQQTVLRVELLKQGVAKILTLHDYATSLKTLAESLCTQVIYCAGATPASATAVKYDRLLDEKLVAAKASAAATEMGDAAITEVVKLIRAHFDVSAVVTSELGTVRTDARKSAGAIIAGATATDALSTIKPHVDQLSGSMHKLRQFAPYAQNREEETLQTDMMAVLCNCIADQDTLNSVTSLRSRLSKKRIEAVLSTDFTRCSRAWAAMSQWLQSGALIGNICSGVTLEQASAFTTWVNEKHEQASAFVAKAMADTVDIEATKDALTDPPLARRHPVQKMQNGNM
jgi:hypothetical protein